MENTPLQDRIFKSLSGQVIILRKRIIAVALAAMLALTAGCGKKEEKTPPTESGIEAVKTEEELRDEREMEEIETSEKVLPERVAALSRNAASMWKIAGGKLAAGVEEASGVPKNAVFGTEDDPDIEAVLNFGADLILVDKVSENYQDMVSLLDMTEGAPPYLVIDIHSFDDYADSMFEMAKYTKDVEAYKLGVIDVRRKNAEVIAHGQEALKVLIQTMPLPEGSLLSEADDDSVMETPDQAKTDSVSDSAESRTAETTVDSSASQAAESGTDSNVSQAAESGTDSNMSQAAESETDSILDQMTESALDSSAESYPADAEKVADKRDSVTVLLMRVDAEGCTIQGSHDYVSNMFADFGLINVNPGYEEVRVTLPKKEDEATSAAGKGETPVNKAAESKTESGATDTAAESAAEVDSKAAEGSEDDLAAESAAEADIKAAEGPEDDPAAESTAEADSKAVEGPEADPAAESAAEVNGQAAGSESTDAQAADSSTGADAKADAGEKDSEAAVDDAGTHSSARPANEIEFETILSRNPDYIFVIYEGKEKAAEQTYKAICESREFWGDMTAVRNRHVYTLPQSTFAYPPNDQWDLAYEYLYQMMFVM